MVVKPEGNRIFVLLAEDLSAIGGPMGSEKVTVLFRVYQRTVNECKEYAEQDYKSKLTWETYVENGRKYISSGDLGYVMYTITEVELNTRIVGE